MSEEEIRIAKLAIYLFGLVSLFGDIIYEGARGVVPVYLRVLGASATMVGLIVGLGEFLGYALRLASGYVADAKKTYWPFFFAGYGLIIAIPLLAFARDWRLAAILILTERIAKAIRSPARDTLLSAATRGYGRGKAFGLHELFDQIGATFGPLMMAAALFYFGRFDIAFALLFIPYAGLVIAINIVHSKLKGRISEALSSIERRATREKLTGNFYFYSLSVLINTAGTFHIAVILYVANDFFSYSLIPIIYFGTQLVDAVVAPVAGVAYDKKGRKVLVVPYALSVVPALAMAMGGRIGVLAAALMFGVVLGMQESIYRAAVADLTGISKRGTAYGIFNTFYGLGFLAAGYLFGMLVDMGLLNIAIIHSIVMQGLALILLKLSLKQ